MDVSMGHVCRLVVYGVAEPQGNKSGRIVKGHVVLTEGFGEGPRKRKQWREAVADAARAWQAEHGAALMDGPLVLTATFYLPRPASAPKRVRYPIRKPDLGKLARSVEDSLTGIIYTDDARIVDLRVAKRFGDPPRVHIEVTPLPDTE